MDIKDGGRIQDPLMYQQLPLWGTWKIFVLHGGLSCRKGNVPSQKLEPQWSADCWDYFIVSSWQPLVKSKTC